MTKKEQQLIFQALGEASMCWSETPKGVFDSTRAKEIGEKLCKNLEEIRKKDQFNLDNNKPECICEGAFGEDENCLSCFP